MLGKKAKVLVKELGEDFHMRLGKELKANLEAKALTMNLSLSEIVRVALNDYLHRDINISTEVLGMLSELEKSLERLRRGQELQSNIFIYFLRFFFAFSGKDIEAVPKEMRKQFFDKGEKRRDDFIRLFKQQTENRVNMLDLLLSEYVAQPVEQNVHEQESDGMGIGD